MACRWHTDTETGVRYHVPECWGTVHDPDGYCHCGDRDLDEFETRDQRIADLTQRLADIEAALRSFGVDVGKR